VTGIVLITGGGTVSSISAGGTGCATAQAIRRKKDARYIKILIMTIILFTSLRRVYRTLTKKGEKGRISCCLLEAIIEGSRPLTPRPFSLISVKENGAKRNRSLPGASMCDQLSF
jgi:hypothetical protein